MVGMVPILKGEDMKTQDNFKEFEGVCKAERAHSWIDSNPNGLLPEPGFLPISSH